MILQLSLLEPSFPQYEDTSSVQQINPQHISCPKPSLGIIKTTKWPSDIKAEVVSGLKEFSDPADFTCKKSIKQGDWPVCLDNWDISELNHSNCLIYSIGAGHCNEGV